MHYIKIDFQHLSKFFFEAFPLLNNVTACMHAINVGCASLSFQDVGVYIIGARSLKNHAEKKRP